MCAFALRPVGCRAEWTEKEIAIVRSREGGRAVRVGSGIVPKRGISRCPCPQEVHYKAVYERFRIVKHRYSESLVQESSRICRDMCPIQSDCFEEFKPRFWPSLWFLPLVSKDPKSLLQNSIVQQNGGLRLGVLHKSRTKQAIPNAIAKSIPSVSLNKA